MAGVEGWYVITYRSGAQNNLHPKTKKQKEEMKKDLDKMIQLGNVKGYRWETKRQRIY